MHLWVLDLWTNLPNRRKGILTNYCRIKGMKPVFFKNLNIDITFSYFFQVRMSVLPPLHPPASSSKRSTKPLLNHEQNQNNVLIVKIKKCHIMIILKKIQWWYLRNFVYLSFKIKLFHNYKRIENHHHHDHPSSSSSSLLDNATGF